MSRDFTAQKSDIDAFTNVFPSTHPVSAARRLMILHRTQAQQSTLFFDDQLVSFSALTLLVWSSGL